MLETNNLSHSHLDTAPNLGVTSTVSGDTIIGGLNQQPMMPPGISDHAYSLTMRDIFNREYYLANNSDVATAVAQGEFVDGYDHFLLHGQFERRDPSDWFNTEYYLNENQDVKASVETGATTAAQHFINFGQHELRDPNVLLDTNYYLNQYPDVMAAFETDIITGAKHFIEFGEKEGRNPSALFNNEFYGKNNLDVQTAVNQGQFRSTLAHFMDYGIDEGRAGSLAAAKNFLVVPPEAADREKTWIVSSRGLYTFLATAEETDGAFSFFNFFVTPNGGGPDLHFHGTEDETLYVLEGEVLLTMGDQTLVAGPGNLSFLPKGRTHTFKNLGDKPARMLSLVMPGGLDRVFNIIGVPEEQGLPGPEYLESAEYRAKLAEVFARFGPPGDPPSQDRLIPFLIVPSGAPGRPSFSDSSGNFYTSLATMQETGGTFSLHNVVIPQQSQVEPLTLSREGESFYIVDGELAFRIGSETKVATPGSFVYVPPGKPFSFINLGPKPVQALEFSTLAGVPQATNQTDRQGTNHSHMM